MKTKKQLFFSNKTTAGYKRGMESEKFSVVRVLPMGESVV